MEVISTGRRKSWLLCRRFQSVQRLHLRGVSELRENDAENVLPILLCHVQTLQPIPVSFVIGHEPLILQRHEGR